MRTKQTLSADDRKYLPHCFGKTYKLHKMETCNQCRLAEQCQENMREKENNQ